jgi:hypothetical protein
VREVPQLPAFRWVGMSLVLESGEGLNWLKINLSKASIADGKNIYCENMIRPWNFEQSVLGLSGTQES